MTRRPLTRKPHGPSTLAVDDVYLVMHAHAVTTPVSTARLTELCAQAYSDRHVVHLTVVRSILDILQNERRVRSYSGSRDAAKLAGYGLDTTQDYQARRARYWILNPD